MHHRKKVDERACQLKQQYSEEQAERLLNHISKIQENRKAKMERLEKKAKEETDNLIKEDINIKIKQMQENESLKANMLLMNRKQRRNLMKQQKIHKAEMLRFTKSQIETIINNVGDDIENKQSDMAQM